MFLPWRAARLSVRFLGGRILPPSRVNSKEWFQAVQTFHNVRDMDVKTIVDAGPLVGWFNKADTLHEWSVAALSGRRGALHTTEIVLGEACFLLGGNTPAAHALLSLVTAGALVLHRPWPELMGRTQSLMLKFSDMDPADASIVVLSELFPRALVVTVDKRHFKIYRRNRKDPLPLLTP